MRSVERAIASWQLIPSDKGRFEVTVNGELLYSKLATGRHPTPEEILALIQQRAGR